MEKVSLPIDEKQEVIEDLIKNNQVIVIAGETGSGKTTRLPQICFSMGLADTGKIAVTQPRRIAATSTAKRVAEEMGTVLGNTVGYRIRFAEKQSNETDILFMTDGMLLAELSHNRNLRGYSTIIIDEAHERSLNIDFLLGYLRTLLKRRPDLKLIISSATIDTELFSQAFDNAPICTVSGRCFSVEIVYDPLDKGDERYIEKAVRVVEDIVTLESQGDILVFMPTERDIMETVDRLKGRNFSCEVLPLFARLTRYQQNRIFELGTQRKIIVSTNIAETSLTVPGIRFVVDTGLARISRYAPHLRTNRLPVEEISQAEVQQRSGRCGRVAEGICIRLYDQKNFESREVYRRAEILRSNLAGVILSMLWLRLGDIEEFPFLEKPDYRSINDAFTQLFELGAVDKERKMTSLGRTMACLPLEPHISRMILQASREGVLEQVSIIAAGLSIVDPRDRPRENLVEADRMHEKFIDGRSDFLTLLKLWESYHRTLDRLQSQRAMRTYCKDHFLSFNRMREWGDVHRQIVSITREQKIRGASQFEDENRRVHGIHRSICTGLISRIARYDAEHKNYCATKNRRLTLFPGSVLAKKKKAPAWIMAQEIVETSRTFARTVSPIELRWVEDFASHLFKRSYGIPWFDVEQGSVLVEEHAFFYGLEIIKGKRRFYGNIDPADARMIFIQKALVEGEMENSLPFLKHNTALQHDVEQEQSQLRCNDYMVGDQELFDFYDKHLGAKIASVKELRTFLKQNHTIHQTLFMKKTDLMTHRYPQFDSFPQKFVVGDRAFPLSYVYKPGAADDGVTVQVPLSETPFLRDVRFDWLVQPLWKEKIRLYLKMLPKDERKHFVPMSDASEAIAAEMHCGAYSFIKEMCRVIRRSYGRSLSADDFDNADLPEHVCIRILVMDHTGECVAETRNPADLWDINHLILEGEEPSEIEMVLEKERRKNIVSWDFGDLPMQRELIRAKDGFALFAYPALSIVDADRIDLICCATACEASKKHARAVIALMRRELAIEFDYLHRDLRFPKSLKIASVPYGGEEQVKERLFSIIEGAVLALPPEYIRTEKEYQHFKETRKSLFTGIAFRSITCLENIFAHARINRSNLATLRSTHSQGSYATLVLELSQELDTYMEQLFEGFCHLALFERYDVYLAAFTYRIEKAFHATATYRRGEKQLLEYQDMVADLVAELGDDSSERGNLVEEFCVLVEEFAIQLFAQSQIKTRVPVSEKRLKQLMDKIKQLSD